MADSGEDRDFPWLRDGDQLFRPGRDWRLNACLNWAPADLSIYAQGYRLAAELVVDSLSRNRMGRDVLVYPIVFLYRHYVELQLKEIAVIAARLAGRTTKVPAHHKLLDLWREVRKAVVEVGGFANEDLTRAEKYLKQLDTADPRSETFRYPYTVKGERIQMPVGILDLEAFRNAMTRLGNFLDSGVDYLAEMQKVKRDAENDY